MDVLDEFSSVIGRIYDATVAPKEWPAALEAVKHLTGSQAVALTSYDLYDRSPPWQLSTGYEPHWIQKSVEKYGSLNPYMDDVAQLEMGHAAAVSMQPDYDRLFETEFYRGWLKPQRLMDACVLIVERSLSAITTLVSVRNEDQGRYDQDALQVLQSLHPHFRRALAISRVLRASQDRMAQFSAMLDSLAIGAILLSAHGEMLYANAEGEAMLTANASLWVNDKRLVLTDSQANRMLRDALAAARRREAGLGDQGVTIPVGEGNDALILHLLPLNAARRASLGSSEAAAHVIFVSRREADDARAVASFSKRFHLTPQEARVLRALIEVGSVPMAAELLGVSSSTARTHVTSIFDKSGVRRQADLIRLLVEMKSPLLRASPSPFED